MSSDNDANNPFKRINADGAPEWHSPTSAPTNDPFGGSSTGEPVMIPVPTETVPYETTPSKPPRGKMLAMAGLLGGTLALSAIGGGAWYAYNQLLGHDDRATAAYAPASSYGYAAMNVDPTSRAWLDAWNMAKRVGLEDELRSLPEQLESETDEPGLWENMIKPAIGREIGVAVWPNADDPNAEPHFAAIVMIDDEAKAREAMANLLEDEDVVDDTYRDIAFQHSPDGDGAGGIIDDALILTDSSEAFEDVVDAHLDGGLDDDADFKDAAERADDDPLLFAWADSAALADVMMGVSDTLMSEGDMDMPLDGATEQLDEAIEQYRALGDVTFTVKADDDALRFVALTEGRPENYPTTAAGEKFAAELPASTLFYMGSSDMYANVFQPLFTQLESFQDDFGSGDVESEFGGDMGSLFGVPSMDDVEAMLGFDIDGDLLAHFVGPYALGVDVQETPGGMSEYGGSFNLYSDVDDAAAITDTLDTIADKLTEQGLPIVRQDDGFAFGAAGVQAELSVENGALHLSGSYNTAGGSGSLTEDADYQRAMAGMEDDASLTGYIALHRVLDLIPDEEFSDADADALAALDALGPMAWGSGPDGDGTRSEMVLFIDEQ
jgi:hypothetical protein